MTQSMMAKPYYTSISRQKSHLSEAFNPANFFGGVRPSSCTVSCAETGKFVAIFPNVRVSWCLDTDCTRPS